MKVAIMGAGAIGAYVGARLVEAGEDVTFIARGAHLEALKGDGLTIESPLGSVEGLRVTATDDPKEAGQADIVIFAVKMWDTGAAAAALAPMIGANTRVVTLQNGIDSVDAIARHVPAQQVIGGVIYLGVVIERPGVISNPGGIHQIIVGEDGGSPEIGAFVASLVRAPGIDAATNPDIRKVIWQKFIRLVGLSASTALTRKAIGDVRSNRDTREYLHSVVEEVVTVARAEGLDFSESHAADEMAFFDGLPPSFHASMLDDLERGKRLELPWLSSRVCELADGHGIAVPANRAAHWALVLHKDGKDG